MLDALALFVSLCSEPEAVELVRVGIYVLSYVIRYVSRTDRSLEDSPCRDGQHEG